MKQVSIVFEVVDDAKCLGIMQNVEDYIQNNLHLEVTGHHTKKIDRESKNR